MCERFFGLNALLDVHVKRPVEHISEVVQLSNSGTALSNASGSFMDSGLDITTNLFLLFDLAHRELRRVSAALQGKSLCKDIPGYSDPLRD